MLFAELAPLFSAETRVQRVPPPAPTATTSQPTCSEELTPFCAAAPSNGALPTPSRLSKRYLHHFVTWDENKEQADEAQDTSHRHTGMDYVVSRVRRPRIGDAVIFWYPKQCLALGFLACVLSNSLGPCSRSAAFSPPSAAWTCGPPCSALICCSVLLCSLVCFAALLCAL